MAGRSHNKENLDDSLTSIQWLPHITATGSADILSTPNNAKHGSHKPQASDGTRGPKPFCRMLDLIVTALYNSSDDEHSLSVQQIYEWIQNNVPYYGPHNAASWKVAALTHDVINDLTALQPSVRHELSKSKYFMRQRVTTSGRDSAAGLWTIVDKHLATCAATASATMRAITHANKKHVPDTPQHEGADLPSLASLLSPSMHDAVMSWDGATWPLATPVKRPSTLFSTPVHDSGSSVMSVSGTHVLSEVPASPMLLLQGWMSMDTPFKAFAPWSPGQDAAEFLRK